jgi:hypothetical protein
MVMHPLQTAYQMIVGTERKACPSLGGEAFDVSAVECSCLSPLFGAKRTVQEALSYCGAESILITSMIGMLLVCGAESSLVT